MNVKHILLTTDLSEEAQRAYAPTVQLAKESDAKITLFTAVLDVRVAPHGALLAPPVSAPEIGSELEAAKESLIVQRELLDPAVDVELVAEITEDIPKAIAAYAAHHDVDLIALSTHGRTGFKRMILGSIAEAVLHHAHVPVLCFPQQESGSDIS